MILVGGYEASNGIGNVSSWGHPVSSDRFVIDDAPANAQNPPLGLPFEDTRVRQQSGRGRETVMIDFKRLEGPKGIPVYFQHLPVNSVSVYWLVFVGSADDESVGNHGIYHWFEHLPSRGTEKYPSGYRDTEARLVRHGGEAGAETSYAHTAYYADVPRRVWTTALDILTDMIARPLLRSEDMEAEREIIHQEIDEWHSSPHGLSMCVLPSLLWPGHPLGHDQLGTRESLQSMSPSLLRTAHQRGYGCSRCVLFVSGQLEEQEVLEEVAKAVEFLPDRDITQRRSPAAYGPLPRLECGPANRISDTAR